MFAAYANIGVVFLFISVLTSGVYFVLCEHIYCLFANLFDCYC